MLLLGNRVSLVVVFISIDKCLHVLVLRAPFFHQVKSKVSIY